ncbi:6-phosphogluconolactonase [Hoeflea prorocentri]|uniref:6-phosphogluconolactonase n=1 Tax=Hoeflea prorocentri TaxID=1922333 RepID=A0A9X3ZHZ2_9HYPH|nr:6-phosphogluconolactonase [Hoeflea prorocentri]MCY6382362.1 6-phosphogluconolactonase [Hoeflea prorocentri]MDA5400162.1 6-phosphogluconolactonase [Hoeflea prorocentri]
MSEPEITRFADGDALAQSLSANVAGLLQSAVDADGAAFFAVSGGNTPRLFFRQLSAADIDWKKVTVTLVDERFVPPSSERSNQRLAAMNLLQDKAALAAFIPLYSDGMTADAAARDAALKFGEIGKPLDVAVLGLGTDGHTASWFPGSPDLGMLTDPQQGFQVMATEAPGQPETRLTLTLPPLMRAKNVILHIEGKQKRSVLENAMNSGPVEELPVRAILRRTERPLKVYWAP